MATMADLRVQADQKRLADLHKKHLAGKISQAEYREYQALIAAKEETEQRAATPQERAWPIGNRDLSELLGVSQKTICAWAKLGMPRSGRDLYDFRLVFPWWSENINSGPEDKDGTITEAKKQYWLEKVRNLRIKTDALAGLYVAQMDVLRSAGDILSRFRNSVRSWRTRLPPILVGKSQEEMLPLIESEMDSALSELANQLMEAKAAGKRPVMKRKRPAKASKHAKPSKPTKRKSK